MRSRAASGELLGEYALDPTNHDPKRLFAYHLPAPEGPAAEDTEPRALERVSAEEFGELSNASNNSPRGIWSDGDIMYVADESDDRVYSYNMPDAINARLASLTLSGVDIGVFDPDTTDYEGAVGEGVRETTVTAEARQRRAPVKIDPPDADEEADRYQVVLAGTSEITVTVTSADGTRTRVYRVALETPPVELALTPPGPPSTGPAPSSSPSPRPAFPTRSSPSTGGTRSPAPGSPSSPAWRMCPD